jgi:hypothetical protein
MAKKKVVMFPSKLRLTHYSELLRQEREQDLKFIEDARRRSAEIMNRATKKDKEH